MSGEQVVCPHCAHFGFDAPAEIRGHVFTREARDHPRFSDLQQWRWTCSCGGRGKWQSQSDSVPYHAWVEHAGSHPVNRG